MSDKTTPLADSDASGNWKTAGIVVLIIILMSVALAVYLSRNTSKFLNYAGTTLIQPETPPPWIADGPLSPEGCVDVALDWARECVGVKQLCDHYVTRVTQECMLEGEESGLHDEYCQHIEALTASSSFGARECAARGVRRDIDAEACGNAYRAIDAHCQYVRDKVRVEAGEEPVGPRKSR